MSEFHDQLRDLAKGGAIQQGPAVISAKGSDFVCGTVYNAYMEAAAGLQTASLLVNSFKADIQSSFDSLTSDVYSSVMSAMDGLLTGMPKITVPSSLNPLSLIAAVNIPAPCLSAMLGMMPDCMLSALSSLVNALGPEIDALNTLVDDANLFYSELKDVAGLVNAALAFPEQLTALLLANAKGLADSALRAALDDTQFLIANCLGNFTDFLASMNIPAIIGQLAKVEACLMINCGRSRTSFFAPGTTTLQSQYHAKAFMLGPNGKVRLTNITTDRAKISMMNRINAKRQLLSFG